LSKKHKKIQKIHLILPDLSVKWDLQPPLPGLSTAPRGLALCGPDEIVAGSVGAPAKGWQWVICEAFLEKIGEPHSFTRGFTIFQTYVS
jgi:hypothetical protein